MANKDYNNINFRNRDIDNIRSRSNMPSNPIDPKQYKKMAKSFSGFDKKSDTLVVGKSNILELAQDQAMLNADSPKINSKVLDTKLYQDNKGVYTVVNRHKKN